MRKIDMILNDTPAAHIIFSNETNRYLPSNNILLMR